MISYWITGSTDSTDCSDCSISSISSVFQCDFLEASMCTVMQRVLVQRRCAALVASCDQVLVCSEPGGDSLASQILSICTYLQNLQYFIVDNLYSKIRYNLDQFRISIPRKLKRNTQTYCHILPIIVGGSAEVRDGKQQKREDKKKEGQKDKN